MLYSPNEYDTYRKVRAILSGQKRHGWVTINARVHPEDADKVRRVLAELAEARRVELLDAMAAKDAERAARRGKLNDHAKAILDLIRTRGEVSRKEIQMLMAERVPLPDSRRVLQSRALRRLEAEGYIRKLPKRGWSIS